MAEVGSDVDFGRKRRLPAWMSMMDSTNKPMVMENEVNERLGSFHVPKFEATKSEEDAIVSGKGIVKNDKQKRVKRLCEKEISMASRGVCLQNRGSRSNDGDKVKPIRKKGALKSKNLKMREANGKLKASNLDGANNNDVELTVEDLISIAQEYVSPENRREGLDTTTDLISNASCLSAKNISLETCKADGTKMSIPRCTTIQSSSDQVDTVGHINEKPRGIIHGNTSNMGDVAQDMLDLFLGPLLQKVDVGERKSDVITIDELNFESKMLARNEIGFEVGAPMEKRKSSLKDQVAMFLN